MSENNVRKNFILYLQLGLIGVFFLLGFLEIRMAYFGKTDQVSYEEESVRSYKYHVGDVLSFAEEATANPYCTYGFSGNEGTHTWTFGHIAKMVFDLEGELENLFLEFSYNVYVAPQRVYVYADGQKIADLTVTEAGSQRLPLPTEYTADGRLELDFVFPDAISPKARGESEDARLLALGMLDICISNDTENLRVGEEYNE